MRPHPRAWIALAALLVAAGVTSANPSAPPRIALFFEPALSDLADGEQRTVELRVEDVPASGIAAFQVRITYDPGKLELRDGNEAFTSAGIQPFAPLGGSPFCAPVRGESPCPDAPWLLTTTGRSAVGTASIEADQGVATIAYATHGGSPPAGGEGVLATFEIIGKSDGAAQLTIADAVLADASDPPRRYAWTRR